MTHCIVGAGFSGLPIAKKLLELGEKVEVLDRNTGVGGLWHTGVYRDAHIISSRKTTQFPCHPMPAWYPDFPSKAQMQGYFDSFARTFGIDAHTRLGVEVKRIRAASGGGFVVTTSDAQERRYDTVAIATGHHWSPRSVSHSGQFRGQVMHSREYFEPSVFADKRVLIVGYGNTGCDLAVAAARVGKSSDISVRSGNYFFPKMLFGIPLIDLIAAMPLSSERSDRWLARLVAAVSVGNLRRYGLPTPKREILDSHPIVNTELLHAIRHGQVGVRPDILRLDDSKVVFTDGSHSEYDLIVYATGYDLTLPMLDSDDALVDWQAGLPVLQLQVMAPKVRGLYFAGIAQGRAGGGPYLERHGAAIARFMALDARSTVPVKDLVAERVRGWSFRPATRPKLWRAGITARACLRSVGNAELTAREQFTLRLADAVGCPEAPSAGVSASA